MAAPTITRPYRTATRTRSDTVAARLVTATVAALPGVGRWLTRTATRARSLALHVGGLGAISAAGWEMSRPLGLLLVGVSLLLFEYLSAPSDDGRSR